MINPQSNDVRYINAMPVNKSAYMYNTYIDTSRLRNNACNNNTNNFYIRHQHKLNITDFRGKQQAD